MEFKLPFVEELTRTEIAKVSPYDFAPRYDRRNKVQKTENFR